jgi:hypothetical protein
VARNHLLAHVVKWYGKIASTPFPWTIDHFSPEILTRRSGIYTRSDNFEGLSFPLSWQLLRPRSAVEGRLQVHGAIVHSFFVIGLYPPSCLPTKCIPAGDIRIL